MITTHKFDSTRDAYDAVNSSDEIKDGDVLVVESERVVGVAVSAWPTAVTVEHGAFHVLNDAASWDALGASDARVSTYTVHPRRYDVVVDGVVVSEHEWPLRAEDAAFEAGGSVRIVELEPYEHTETIAAVPATDYSASRDVALAIADALWGPLDPHEDDHSERIAPTSDAKTIEGHALLDTYAVGARVSCTLLADPWTPEIKGVGTIAGVVEDVRDTGDGESGPIMHVWVALGVWLDGAVRYVHPDDDDATIALVEVQS